jgi:dienelactone hydrolase
MPRSALTLTLGLAAYAAVATVAAGEPSADVRIETTPTGVRFGTWGEVAAGPAPTLVLLANTIEGTLGDAYYRQAGGVLGAAGVDPRFLCVSIDLPCHGLELRKGEPAELAGWRHRLEHGADPIADVARRLAAVLDHLVATGRTDASRIAVAGTSRGGFMALHVAARDPRLTCVVAYAPVIDLAALREFAGAESLPAVRAADLHGAAGTLAGRPVWMAIGADDRRVDTRRAVSFAAAVRAATVAAGCSDRLTLIVDPETTGHTTPAGAAERSAAWILEQCGGPRK